MFSREASRPRVSTHGATKKVALRRVGRESAASWQRVPTHGATKNISSRNPPPRTHRWLAVLL